MSEPPTTPSGLRLESDRRLAMLATSLIMLPNAMFAYTDAAVIKDPARLALAYAVRALTLAGWGFGVYEMRRARSHDALRRVNRVISVSVVLFLIGIQLARPASNWWAVRSSLVLSMLIFVAYPDLRRYQIATWSLLAASTLALIRFYYVTMTPVDQFSIVVNLVLAGALGLAVASSRRRLELDLVTAHERELAALAEQERADEQRRALERSIRICPDCGEVQAAGGEWTRIEQYAHERSDARFSHGICPTCLMEHFPQFAEPGHEQR